MSPSETILGSVSPSGMKSPLQVLNEGSKLLLDEWRVEDDPILITNTGGGDGVTPSSFPPVGSRTVASPMRARRLQQQHAPPGPPMNTGMPSSGGVSAVMVPTSPIRSTRAAHFTSPQRHAQSIAGQQSTTVNHGGTPIREIRGRANTHQTTAARGKDDDDFSKLFSRTPFAPQVAPKLDSIPSEEVLGIDALRSDDDRPKLGDDVLIPGAGSVPQFGVASLNSNSSLLPRSRESTTSTFSSKAPGRPLTHHANRRRRAPGPPTPSSSRGGPSKASTATSPATPSPSSGGGGGGGGPRPPSVDPNRIGFERLALDDRPPQPNHRPIVSSPPGVSGGPSSDTGPSGRVNSSMVSPPRKSTRR